MSGRQGHASYLSGIVRETAEHVGVARGDVPVTVRFRRALDPRVGRQSRTLGRCLPRGRAKKHHCLTSARAGSRLVQGAAI